MSYNEKEVDLGQGNIAVDQNGSSLDDYNGRRKESKAEAFKRRFSVTSTGDLSATEGQMFSMMDVDPALDAKMHVVNNVGSR